MPTIVALVKHVPDTWSTKALQEDFTLDRETVDNVIDEVNEYSVEAALRLKETNPDHTVVALTMGPAQAEEALRKALAMGADDAVLLSDASLAGSDALGTAWALHNALNFIAQKYGEVAVITLGNQASDSSTGVLAGLLAEYRQVPALTNLVTVSLAEGVVRGTREDSRGQWEIQAPVPALISVSDKADKPRFPNFKGIMAAKKHEITVVDITAIGVDAQHVGAAAAPTQVTAAVERPARTAGELITSGSPADMAKQVADYLSAKNLI
ncbi:MAG: electron transfer flavoprotein subunit beta/FixA family protein [Corynebacterium sp.]|nr:electron transfer flavoprotein subunit beta/FixA family protein [Corynebacterium sp.]